MGPSILLGSLAVRAGCFDSLAQNTTCATEAKGDRFAGIPVVKLGYTEAVTVLVDCLFFSFTQIPVFCYISHMQGVMEGMRCDSSPQMSMKCIIYKNKSWFAIRLEHIITR